MRVLIVDNLALARAGLRAALQQASDMEIVGEADDGKLAVELARELHPDVVLMDPDLPVLDSVEATRRICAECPGVRVIATSLYDQVDRPQAMRDAGAVAFVGNESATVLLAANRGATTSAHGAFGSC